jgi:FkbM family methyltransferase
MGKLKNAVKKKLGNSPFFKNKIYSAAIDMLKDKENDIPYFFEQLEQQILKSPDKYIELLNRIQENAEENFKFKPREKDKHKWIQEMNVNTVIDVGASHGDSAEFYNGLFPNAHIYSFEPLHDSYKKLEARKTAIPKLTTFNFALGEKQEKVKMNRSEFTPSSSLLKMNDTHKEVFPFTAGEISEEIEVRTLDSVAGEINFKENVLLKIDVQGFEESVLKGAMQSLKKVKIIIIELSFVELYSGSPKFDHIYKLLTGNEFIYSGSWHQLRSPKDGRILQQNGVFIKTS